MVNKYRKYRLSPLAVTDLEEIWLYTFRQWSLEQADSYHQEIITAIQGLAEGYKIGQPSGIRDGYWKYKSGRHVLYFRLADDFLDVIRILHERMDVDFQLK